MFKPQRLVKIKGVVTKLIKTITFFKKIIRYQNKAIISSLKLPLLHGVKTKN
jgi:hypothetical protein